MRRVALLFVAVFAIISSIGISVREPFINKGHETRRDGDIVDCVDIHKQPSLNHPNLKNHVIQKNPSWKTTTTIDTSSLSAPRPRYGPAKPCPMNTVPILRSRASANLNQKIDITTGQHPIYVTYDDEDVVKYGAGADINVYNLSLAQDQFSSHHIWVVSNISGHLNMVVAGWRVDPQLYGDSQTRLFTYWTGDDNGCYNALCPGFIQSDPYFYPGIILSPASTYGGLQFTTRLDIMMDKATGNWWLMYDRKHPIGYWPNELFKSLVGGANLVSWGGSGKAGKDGICPPLGNGHFPDEGRTAMYMRDVEYVDHNYRSVSVNEVELRSGVDGSGCYGLQQLPRVTATTYYLYFGGPGGCYCGGV